MKFIFCKIRIFHIFPQIVYLALSNYCPRSTTSPTVCNRGTPDTIADATTDRIFPAYFAYRGTSTFQGDRRAKRSLYSPRRPRRTLRRCWDRAQWLRGPSFREAFVWFSIYSPAKGSYIVIDLPVKWIEINYNLKF